LLNLRDKGVAVKLVN